MDITTSMPRIEAERLRTPNESRANTAKTERPADAPSRCAYA
jgi:hypothetical protein